tara:strand:- start:326 stop:475 length:150 start_codon:yes stop_codon:yes gene_type:complete
MLEYFKKFKIESLFKENTEEFKYQLIKEAISINTIPSDFICQIFAKYKY